MIVEAILGVLTTFINWIISMIPDIALSNNFTSTITTLYDIWHDASFFIPIGWITFCIAWMFLVYNFSFCVSLINWVIRKIPTIE